MRRPGRLPALSLLALAGALAGPAARVLAQTVPGTDVFLVDVRREAAGRLVLGVPVNLTARPGYDNQPAFSADGSRLYYTAIGADGHADVCRMLLSDRSRSCWETTPESEYSAADAPMGGVSVVRVERDSTQRLWRLPETGEPELLLPNLAPAGYYAWLDTARVVAFVLGSPPTLVLADLRTREHRVLASDVGRSIQRVPAGGGRRRKSRGRRGVRA